MSGLAPIVTPTPYKYDFEGKLVSVGDATSSTRSSYVYDGDGNRLSSIVTTGGVAKTVRYLNDTNTAYVQVVEERDENGWSSPFKVES